MTGPTTAEALKPDSSTATQRPSVTSPTSPPFSPTTPGAMFGGGKSAAEIFITQVKADVREAREEKASQLFGRTTAEGNDVHRGYRAAIRDKWKSAKSKVLSVFNAELPGLNDRSGQLMSSTYPLSTSVHAMLDATLALEHPSFRSKITPRMMEVIQSKEIRQVMLNFFWIVIVKFQLQEHRRLHQKELQRRLAEGREGSDDELQDAAMTLVGSIDDIDFGSSRRRSVSGSTDSNRRASIGAPPTEPDQLENAQRQFFHNLAIHYGTAFAGYKIRSGTGGESMEKDAVFGGLPVLVAHTTYYTLTHLYSQETDANVFNKKFRRELYRTAVFWFSGIQPQVVPTKGWPVDDKTIHSPTSAKRRASMAAKETERRTSISSNSDSITMGSGAPPPPLTSFAPPPAVNRRMSDAEKAAAKKAEARAQLSNDIEASITFGAARRTSNNSDSGSSPVTTSFRARGSVVFMDPPMETADGGTATSTPPSVTSPKAKTLDAPSPDAATCKRSPGSPRAHLTSPPTAADSSFRIPKIPTLGHTAAKAAKSARRESITPGSGHNRQRRTSATIAAKSKRGVGTSRSAIDLLVDVKRACGLSTSKEEAELVKRDTEERHRRAKLSAERSIKFGGALLPDALSESQDEMAVFADEMKQFRNKGKKKETGVLPSLHNGTQHWYEQGRVHGNLSYERMYEFGDMGAAASVDAKDDITYAGSRIDPDSGEMVNDGQAALRAEINKQIDKEDSVPGTRQASRRGTLFFDASPAGSRRQSMARKASRSGSLLQKETLGRRRSTRAAHVFTHRKNASVELPSLVPDDEVGRPGGPPLPKKIRLPLHSPLIDHYCRHVLKMEEHRWMENERAIFTTVVSHVDRSRAKLKFGMHATKIHEHAEEVVAKADEMEQRFKAQQLRNTIADNRHATQLKQRAKHAQAVINYAYNPRNQETMARVDAAERQLRTALKEQHEDTGDIVAAYNEAIDAFKMVIFEMPTKRREVLADLSMKCKVRLMYLQRQGPFQFKTRPHKVEGEKMTKQLDSLVARIEAVKESMGVRGDFLDEEADIKREKAEQRKLRSFAKASAGETAHNFLPALNPKAMGVPLSPGASRDFQPVNWSPPNSGSAAAPGQQSLDSTIPGTENNSPRATSPRDPRERTQSQEIRDALFGHRSSINDGPTGDSAKQMSIQHIRQRLLSGESLLPEFMSSADRVPSPKANASPVSPPGQFGPKRRPTITPSEHRQSTVPPSRETTFGNGSTTSLKKLTFERSRIMSRYDPESLKKEREETERLEELHTETNAFLEAAYDVDDKESSVSSGEDPEEEITSTLSRVTEENAQTEDATPVTARVPPPLPNFSRRQSVNVAGPMHPSGGVSISAHHPGQGPGKSGSGDPSATATPVAEQSLHQLHMHKQAVAEASLGRRASIRAEKEVPLWRQQIEEEEAEKAEEMEKPASEFPGGIPEMAGAASLEQFNAFVSPVGSPRSQQGMSQGTPVTAAAAPSGGNEVPMSELQQRDTPMRHVDSASPRPPSVVPAPSAATGASHRKASVRITTEAVFSPQLPIGSNSFELGSPTSPMQVNSTSLLHLSTLMPTASTQSQQLAQPKNRFPASMMSPMMRTSRVTEKQIPKSPRPPPKGAPSLFSPEKRLQPAFLGASLRNNQSPPDAAAEPPIPASPLTARGTSKPAAPDAAVPRTARK